jgi:NADPH:quinone reductase-like Zn-dependent oxidoreductase
MRSIGADHVIDYTKADFTEAGKRYDFILDNVSNHPLSRLRAVLTDTGVLIPNGGEFGNRWFASAGRLLRGAVLFRLGGQKLGNFLVSTNHADLVALKDLIEAGKVTPVMGGTYPLSRTAEALDRIGRGHARGKVVITV